MLSIILLAFSFVCAVLAAFWAPAPPYNLLAAAFAFFIAALLFGGGVGLLGGGHY